MFNYTEVPLYPEPFYTYSLDLDNTAYDFTFRYSTRAEAYLMDITSVEGTPLIKSIKVLPYVRLLYQYSLEDIDGDFMLIPRQDVPLYEAEIVNPKDIYKTHILIYVSPED